MDEKELLNYAAAIETHFRAPNRQGNRRFSRKTASVKNFKSIAGKGAQGKVDGKEVEVVSPGFLKKNDIPLEDERIDSLSSQGKTLVFVLIDGDLKGVIALARPHMNSTYWEIRFR
ncbi:MAG: hypothetical protein WBB23_22785 [Desulforhopalus sp.]